MEDMEIETVDIGYRSGLLEVIAKAAPIRGERSWLCRCDCGGEKAVTDAHLKSKHTKSCGCLSRRKALAPDMHIEQLTLIKELPRRSGRYYWLCRCDCGNECEIQESHIRNGHTKSCGCLTIKKSRERGFKLYGRQFGRLKVMSHNSELINGSYKWLCRCVCGGEIYVETDNLLSGHTRSCGCLNEERRRENFQKAIHFVDGTCIEKIANPRETVANTSGHRGVWQIKNGNWRASITFRGKQYDLGTHATFEEAVEARLKGEEKYFGEYLESYWERNKATT